MAHLAQRWLIYYWLINKCRYQKSAHVEAPFQQPVSGSLCFQRPIIGTVKSRVDVFQGTVAVEFLEQVPDLDAILIAVSGGGLSTGIAVVAKQLNPNIKIILISPQGRSSY